jgi:hypothetical protein
MAEREHFTNGRCFTGATGLALVFASFSAQINSWPHWISIGMGYGAGIVLMLLAAIWITKSYYSRHEQPQFAVVPPLAEEEEKMFFSPLQIEAFQLSRDIIQYVSGLGPKPELDKPGTTENRKKIEERQQWREKLIAGYDLRFADRDKAISLKFAEKGISITILQEAEYVEPKIHQWAEELVAMAHKVDGLNLSVGARQ